MKRTCGNCPLLTNNGMCMRVEATPTMRRLRRADRDMKRLRKLWASHERAVATKADLYDLLENIMEARHA